MEKFIPFGKLSKRKQRELNLKRRGTWGDVNPVTRKPKDPKAYVRKKTRRWTDDDGASGSLLLLTFIVPAYNLAPSMRISRSDI